ncbi:hypothetical protein MMC25_004939 [Agyrium rufum]|nr:hypothetical protein [Agyrium rufum]
MNDSSFAAVTTLDSRIVFFQDLNGTLRQAIYSSSSQEWNTGDDLLIPYTSNARENTPMSAIINTYLAGQDEIFLFYVDDLNNVTIRWYTRGSWASPEDSAFADLPNVITAAQSRSLSITAVPNTDDNVLCLFVEEPAGTVSTFLGNKNLEGELLEPFDPFTWIWQNITGQLYDPNPLNASEYAHTSSEALYPPFTSNVFDFDIGVNGTASVTTVVQLTSFSLGPNPIINSSLWLNDSPPPPQDYNILNTPELWIPLYESNSDISFIQANEPVVHASFYTGLRYYFWINGTSLTSDLCGGNPVETSGLAFQFPYQRFATTTQNGTEAIYLYHQINASTFSEKIYNVDTQVWNSFNITLPTT